MTSDRLSTLQRDILRVLADRNCGFFLTGGGVLVGWVLGHRATDDLDLFTAEDQAIAQADALARALAAGVRAEVEPLQTAPDHRRYLFTRGAEGTRVDFVRDRGVQLHDKPLRDGVPMDTVEEIIANKITTLASRSEIRDVVDLYYLERAGHRIEDHLEAALQKDAGATPATIAWVLSSLRVPATVPGEVSAREIGQYIEELERRMRSASLPDP